MNSTDDGYEICTSRKKRKPKGRAYEVRRYHRCGDVALTWIFDKAWAEEWAGYAPLSTIRAAAWAALDSGAMVPLTVFENLRQAISGRKMVAATYLEEEKAVTEKSRVETMRHQAFIGVLEDILVILELEG